MIYLDIVRFSFLRFFTFPVEIISQLLKRVVEILFLILFWALIINTGQVDITLKQIISYFLISVGISDLVMSRWGAFGSYLGGQIKNGGISVFMLRPQSIIFSLYAISVGRTGFRIMLAVINICLGIILFPPQSYISILLFILFFINALAISFSYNLFEGILYFHTTEASGIRNTIQHITRMLSGGMVPLYLFPSALKKIIELTPFPAMVYTPTIALAKTSVTDETLIQLATGMFWVLIMNFLVYRLWKWSIKNYEAVGI